jgi:ribosomal protein L32
MAIIQKTKGKKKASHPNDAYKNMVNPATGKKGQMGGEGTTPPFSNPGRDLRPYKKLDPATSAKNGKSFPDLNKDGKVTKADILKGRGVIAKNGGSVSAGTKGQSKRVGPVDPKGAYTKVQKRTLAKAKTKASLTKDKQLGATKMKNGGCMKCGGKMSKKK